MFLCRTLDYPVIPADLIDTIQLGDVIREYPGRVCKLNNQEFTTSAGTYYQVNQEIDSWVRNNIDLDIDFVGIRYQYGSPDHNSQGVHTDATRDYALLYAINNAGGNLKFWQQTNQPVEQDELHLITDYDSIKELESFDIQNNQWYLVNGRVLHSVEGITSTRITLQVNLKSL